MAQEQSLLSLILGEKEVLVRVTPISSEMEENLFLNTSKRIGFTFTASSFGKLSHHRDTEDTENIFDLPGDTGKSKPISPLIADGFSLLIFPRPEVTFIRW
jgi:hypothetical protein